MDKFERLSQSVLEIGYHTTNVSPDIILKNGLTRGNNGLTEKEMMDNIDNYLPQNRIYISKDPFLFKAQYCYAVNIFGLKKFPDYGSFPDNYAYMETNTMWWKDRDVEKIKNSTLKNILKNNDCLLFYSDVTGEDTWDWFGTCVVEGPISIDRIKLVKQ